jgi:hypothetical protein
MARLTVQTDLSGTVTRQTLFDAWEDANITAITEEDFGDDALSIKIGSSFSDAPAAPIPGAGFWNQGQQLFFVYTDVLEDTAVSLWLAVGPDAFECACLAAEPIPAGAVVEPFYDRWVKVGAPSEPQNADIGRNAYMGINQSGIPEDSVYTEGDTAASGTWIRVGIDGFLKAWFPKEDTNVSDGEFGSRITGQTTSWQGVLDGGRFRGGLGQPNISDLICDNQVALSIWMATTPSGESLNYARVKWLGGLVRTAG